MNNRREVLAGLATIAATTAMRPAGAQTTADQTAAKLPVVATFSILADLARNVGGGRTSLSSLVGPDGDAHVYQPSPTDSKTLSAARLIVVNGFNLEGWIDRLILAAGAHAPVIVATKGITPRQRNDGEEAGIDPHAWQSIANAKIYVANIRDGLSAADPAGAAAYSANAAGYTAQLEALETEVKAKIAAIPENRRRIITTHDAFGYFGAAYGFSFIAPQGVSTETEPSARDVGKIILQIKAQKIPAIFLENISDPRLIQRIAQESGAKVGGTLFSDALSPAGGPATTYIDMMRHNVGELSRALIT